MSVPLSVLPPPPENARPGGRVAAVAAVRAALAAESLAVVSFDVFDTLLSRRCTTPLGVFERAYARLPLAERSPHRAMAFVQHRMTVEGELRRRAELGGGSAEVSIEAIYAAFPGSLFGISEPEVLVAAEFAAECDLCAVNPEIAGLLKTVRASGVSAGLISDTYWSDAQLAALLRHCDPSLEWDFLYASVSHGTGKTGDLFGRHLQCGGFSATAALHVGDNPDSDVRSAARFGIRAFLYPQADAAMRDILAREDTVFQAACAQAAGSVRLDGGVRTRRREALGRMPLPDPEYAYGARVLGAVMAAFDDFVATRVAEVGRGGGRVAVAFVSRDGFLPREVWQARGRGDAPLICVNRRTAMMAAIDVPEVLSGFLGEMKGVDLSSFQGFFKFENARVRKYFRGFPGGIAPGSQIAADIFDLIPAQAIGELAATSRTRLLAHLRREIPCFDDVTDLMLVDLGYSGTVQKRMRDAFDRIGLPQRLHGVYLIGVDEDLAEISPPDSAAWMIGDAVLLPNVRRGLLSNVAVLEQLCSMATGTVRGYDPQGVALQEAEVRNPEHVRICGRIREGAVAFAAALPPQPHEPLAASWAAAGLGRMLLLPTDNEIDLLAKMQHDVNLGTASITALADPDKLRSALVSRPFAGAFSFQQTAMWMGGSAMEISPLVGSLHAALALGAIDAAALADAAAGVRTVVICDRRDNHSVPLALPVMRGARGELRFRVPLRRGAHGFLVAFPAASLPRSGCIEGIVFGVGEAAKTALTFEAERSLPLTAVSTVGMKLAGEHFTGDGENGFLAVEIPPFEGKVGVLAVAVTSLDGSRVFAARESYA